MNPDENAQVYIDDGEGDWQPIGWTNSGIKFDTDPHLNNGYRFARAVTFKPARQETPVSTYDDYIAFVDGYRRQHPQQREGQAHFNVFSIVHPDLAKGMDGFEGHNPFYDDGNLRPFLAYVRWELGRGGR